MLPPIMPFGRYKGRHLDELPDSYLGWLSTRELREPLRSDVRDEVHRRRYDEEDTHRAYKEHQRQPYERYEHRQYSTSRQHSQPNVQDVDDIITSGLRTLAKLHHPDIGGDLAKMQAINHAADWLRVRVRELLP